MAVEVEQTLPAEGSAAEPDKGTAARRVLAELPGPALIALAVVAVFWPLVGQRGLLVTGEAAVSDAIYQTYPFRVMLGRALAAGHLPFWVDDIACGFPLLANPSVGSLYPLNWLYGVLPPAAAAAWVLVLSCMLAGWLMYAYVRVLGLGRAPAALAGVSFACCGFFVCHAKHVAFVNTGCWLPLLLLLVERARQGGRLRTLLWLAPVIALMGLAGGTQVLYLAGLLLAVYAPVRLLTAAGPYRRRLLLVGGAVGAVALGAAMTAPQALPSLELTSVSQRKGGLPYTATDAWPMPLRDLLTVGWSSASGLPGDDSYRRRDPENRSIFWEDYAYLGWPTVLFALAGAGLLWRRHRLCRLLVILTALGTLLALGVQTGLFAMAYYTVPGLRYFRFPQRFLLWQQVCVPVLGALGLAAILARLPRWWQVGVAGAALLALVVDLAVCQGRLNVYYDRDAWQEEPATARAVHRGMGPFGGRIATVAPGLTHRLSMERGGQAANRVLFWRHRALLQPDGNALWGLPQLGGYVELVPQWMQIRGLSVGWYQGLMTLGLVQRQRPEMVLRASPSYTRLLESCGVQYVLAAWPLRGEGLQLVVGDGTVWLYRLPSSLGRAYLVPRAVDGGTDADMLRAAKSGADFRRAVYLLGKSRHAEADFPATPVQVAPGDRPTELTIPVEAPATCWLVLTDSYYPGWQATVDGKPTPVERANCWMRAVQVPAGRHRVEFRYVCRPYQRGLVLGGIALGLWLLAMAASPWVTRAVAGELGRGAPHPNPLP